MDRGALWATVCSITLSWLRLREAFLGGSDDKESACNAGDQGLTPGLGKPRGGNGDPL